MKKSLMSTLPRHHVEKSVANALRLPFRDGESSSDNYSSIRPDHFFVDELGKVGRNFFAFELASEIKVNLSPKIVQILTKGGYTQERINQSCIHLGKLLTADAVNTLDQQKKGMAINYERVETAFPGISDKTLNALLDIAGKAWGAILDICCVCPNACLTNRHKYSPAFDDESYYE